MSAQEVDKIYDEGEEVDVDVPKRSKKVAVTAGRPTWRPELLYPNYTMGPGLAWIKRATTVTFFGWLLVMVYGWATFTCREDDPSRKVLHKFSYVFAAASALYAVRAEWNAVKYCLRPFLEIRKGLFLFGLVEISVTKFLLLRLTLTFLNVLGPFLFGLSAIQAAGDESCRDSGKRFWRFAWDATWLQSHFAVFLGDSRSAFQFWNDTLNIRTCYGICAVIMFVPTLRAMLMSTWCTDVKDTCEATYVVQRDDEGTVTAEYWAEKRFKTTYHTCWDCFRTVVARTLEFCCCKPKDYWGKRGKNLCHFMANLWDSTFFNEASAGLARAVGFAALRDMTTTASLHELEQMLDADIGDAKTMISVQRRMIIVFHGTIRSTLQHTVLKAGLMLNLQVTQFMLHRAVLLKSENEIPMDWLAFVSMMLTMVPTLLFDPYQVAVALWNARRVVHAKRRFENSPAYEQMTPDDSYYLKKEQQTIWEKLVFVLFDCFVGYALLFYAVLKLYNTLFNCLGQGYNFGACAEIPWGCMGSPAAGESAGEREAAEWRCLRTGAA